MTSSLRSRNSSSMPLLAHNLDDAVHLLVHRRHAEPALTETDVLAKELALTERAQREHALGQPGMRGEHLAVAPEALLRFVVLFEERLDVELVVELLRAESELRQRAQRDVEVACAEGARAVAGDLGAPRPGSQGEQRRQRHIAQEQARH